jgi:rhamnosyltransferase
VCLAGDQVTKLPSGDSDVCAVVVTHHPDAGWAARLGAIAAEVAEVVVVDNGSDAVELELITRAVAAHRAHLICNQSNLGLAAALNQGATHAFARGFRFVLLFDQDTEPLPGIGAELTRVYALASQSSKVAAVGSNFVRQKTKTLTFHPRPHEHTGWTSRRTVITSGCLIERGAFAAVGPFREELFIDFVDHDYCLRARAMGYLVAAAISPLIVHSIGAPSVHHFLGLTLVTSNHVAWRRYLMTRNRVVLMREHCFREPAWVLASAYTLLAETVKILCLEEQKATKLRHVLAGAWRGLWHSPKKLTMDALS